MSADRKDARRLYLDFDCLRSIPEGINEVHVWWDTVLGVERVGKLIDISGLEHDDSLPEPATLQAISHPNIVPVVAAARRTDYPAPLDVVELITPFYKRGSITDALLREERFSVTEALAIARNSLNGIAELHDAKKILHRDIKSGNILLTTDNSRAKVADLGLAALLRPDQTAMTANNPTLYSPPEFFHGNLTVASDLYAMGLVLYELLGGPFPYADYTRAAVVDSLARNASAVRARDLVLPPYVPTSLRKILRKSCAREPERRYVSAREMAAALAKVVAVDWEQVGGTRWESEGSGRKRVRVEARRQRSGSYVVEAYTFGKVRWRSFHRVSVPDLSSAELVRAFEKATAVAITR